MAAGNRIEFQYPANKLPREKTKREAERQHIIAETAKYEAKYGKVRTLPTIVNGASQKCSRDGCEETAPFKHDGNGRRYFCSQKCSQKSKSAKGWSSRVKNA